MHENEISGILLDSGIELHRALGPGLFESVYEVALVRALEKRGLQVERQVPIAIAYDGHVFEEAFRADLVVGGKVLVELKSVEHVLPIHRKQVLTYLRLSGLRLAILMNFGALTMKDGFERVADRLPKHPDR